MLYDSVLLLNSIEYQVLTISLRNIDTGLSKGINSSAQWLRSIVNVNAMACKFKIWSPKYSN